MDQSSGDGQALLLRAFTSEDQRDARLLILDGLGEYFGIIDESLNPDLDDITAHFLSHGHDFVVAELSGSLVGTGALVRVSAGVGRLVRLSVKGEYRRQGIGRALIKHLLGLARQRGYRRVIVETNHDWFGAIRFYQSHGFQMYDLDEESIHMCLDVG